MSIEIVILVDDTALSSQLQAQHGLSIWITGPGRQILFDAGATEKALLNNCCAMGLSLAELDGLIISNGHNDHTGGISAVAAARAGLGVFAHANVFCRRWQDQPGHSLNEISCPVSAARLGDIGARINYVKAPEMLEDWLVLSGPIGGKNLRNENFIIRKGDQLLTDHFEDENFVLVKGQAGWTVITGCCYRGLKNTLRLAKFLTHGQRIQSIIGGLHLAAASQPELDQTAELLREFAPIDIYPCHCSGQNAFEFLKGVEGLTLHDVGAGTRIQVQ